MTEQPRVSTPSPHGLSPALRVALNTARAALIVLPSLWLVRRVDIAGISAGIVSVGWPRLALGLLLQLCLSCVVSFRWRVLLSSYLSLKLPSLVFLLRANLVANYFALLPIPGADDGVRIARTLGAFPSGAPSAWIVIAIERTSGLVGLLLLALLSSFVAHSVLGDMAVEVLALGSAVAFVLTLPVLVLPSWLSRKPDLASQIERLPVIGKTLAQLGPPARNIDLGYAVLLSVVSHFGSSAVIALLFSPLDPNATLAVCVRVQPIVLLAMAVPLTPGGIGQRELAFAALYGLAGISSTHAVTVALLSFALALAQAAVGGGVYVLERLYRAKRTQRAFVDD